MESHQGCSAYGIQELQAVYHQEPFLLQHCAAAAIPNHIFGGGTGSEGGDDGFYFAAENEAPDRFGPLQFQTNASSVGVQDIFFPSITYHPQLPLAPASTTPSYGFRRASSAFQFSYDGGGTGSSTNSLGLAGLCMGSAEAFFRGGSAVVPSPSYPFGGLQAEFSKMTAQEIMDAKALAASRSHSEAERRRRERINGHLAMLRSMLPNTTKTDKASLLAEVIQHVKELKRQTSEIADESLLPSETDQLTVEAASDDDGKFIIRASLCCEDRSDLLPELIRALKALKLRALKAEITTLGGRVRNNLVVTGEDDSDSDNQQQNLGIIQEALRAVMERAAAEETSASLKRQRTSSLASILEHKSI